MVNVLYGRFYHPSGVRGPALLGGSTHNNLSMSPLSYSSAVSSSFADTAPPCGGVLGSQH